MKYKTILIIFVLFFSNVLNASGMLSGEVLLSEVNASGAQVIKGTAPNGIEYLETKIKSHTGAPINEGSYGEISYCYKKNIYIVYITNLLGHGYELSKKQAKNIKCIKTNKKIIGKNKLGLYIGMTKTTLETLLKVKKIKNKQTIIWIKELEDNGTKYDRQTYLKLLFIENKLVYLSVFTTETT
jgi:hypothetical protein